MIEAIASIASKTAVQWKTWQLWKGGSPEMDERDEDFFPEDDWFFGSIVETDESVEVNCVAMEKHLAK